MTSLCDATSWGLRAASAKDGSTTQSGLGARNRSALAGGAESLDHLGYVV